MFHGTQNKMSTLTLVQWFQPQLSLIISGGKKRRKKERSSNTHHTQRHTEHQLCLMKLRINTEQALAWDIWLVFRLSLWLMIGQVTLSQVQNHNKRKRRTVVTEKQTKMKERHNRLFLRKLTNDLWNSPFTFQIKWKIRSQKQNQWVSAPWKPWAAFFLGCRNSTMLQKNKLSYCTVTVKALFQCQFLILMSNESHHTSFSFCFYSLFLFWHQKNRNTHHTWLFTWWYPGEAGHRSHIQLAELIDTSEYLEHIVLSKHQSISLKIL